MDKIQCSVENCSHNKESVCYANTISIGGNGAKSADNTCCGSFLDKHHYSTLTNNTNSHGSCKSIKCIVSNCTYNKNKLCSADHIQVNGSDVNIYTETECSTFKLK